MPTDSPPSVDLLRGRTGQHDNPRLFRLEPPRNPPPPRNKAVAPRVVSGGRPYLPSRSSTQVSPEPRPFSVARDDAAPPVSQRRLYLAL
mmetsp:Transcript_22921/g.71903  ORF Transcript_22921/g.71903 Transcript_22921/m.71903 type:complete len:89 (+) Transcript_22921:1590-1856(+)